MSNELNQRVAKAMGLGPWHGKAFDTDPATIPEMLAWLRKASYGYAYGGLQIWDLFGDDGYEASIGIGEDDSRHDRHFRQGITLNLALANLVVAVSEAKKP